MDEINVEEIITEMKAALFDVLREINRADEGCESVYQAINVFDMFEPCMENILKYHLEAV